MQGKELTLIRDCTATAVPDGDKVILAKGTQALVKQALGGQITLQNSLGIYQVPAAEADALGPEAEAFLAQSADAPGEGASGPLDERVWMALRQCYDPEIPVNIVDLGLIYDLRLSEGEAGEQDAAIQMTLTTQGCGMGPAIANDAKEKVMAVPGIRSAEVSIVWDPPWNPRMISEEGKEKLGLT